MSANDPGNPSGAKPSHGIPEIAGSKAAFIGTMVGIGFALIGLVALLIWILRCRKRRARQRRAGAGSNLATLHPTPSGRGRAKTGFLPLGTRDEDESTAHLAVHSATDDYAEAFDASTPRQSYAMGEETRYDEGDVYAKAYRDPYGAQAGSAYYEGAAQQGHVHYASQSHQQQYPQHAPSASAASHRYSGVAPAHSAHRQSQSIGDNYAPAPAAAGSQHFARPDPTGYVASPQRTMGPRDPSSGGGIV